MKKMFNKVGGYNWRCGSEEDIWGLEVWKLLVKAWQSRPKKYSTENPIFE
jgi:hypothetical protein